MGKVIGPGGVKKDAKCGTGRSVGPGGTVKTVTTTTQRGYENDRTIGLRSNMQVTGNAKNSKA
jgi:hypothetical protein